MNRCDKSCRNGKCNNSWVPWHLIYSSSTSLIVLNRKNKETGLSTYLKSSQSIRYLYPKNRVTWMFIPKIPLWIYTVILQLECCLYRISVQDCNHVLENWQLLENSNNSKDVNRSNVLKFTLVQRHLAEVNWDVVPDRVILKYLVQVEFSQ